MHANFFAIVAFVSAAVAVAMPQGNAQCNVGQVQCCNSVQPASDSFTRSRIETLHGQGLLGDNDVKDILNDSTGKVGIDCTSVSAIGVLNRNNCATQPVCCNGNNFSGFVVVGCSPFDVG